MNKKGKIEPNIIASLIVLLFGFTASFLVFIGFALQNSTYKFVGSLLLGIIGIAIQVIEWWMSK